jgi:hypothetical protein
MKPHEFVGGLLTGCLLMIFGLVPSLFHKLIEGVQNFRDSVMSGMSMRHTRRIEREQIQKPVWMVLLGVVFVVMSLLNYFSK